MWVPLEGGVPVERPNHSAISKRDLAMHAVRYSSHGIFLGKTAPWRHSYYLRVGYRQPSLERGYPTMKVIALTNRPPPAIKKVTSTFKPLKPVSVLRRFCSTKGENGKGYGLFKESRFIFESNSCISAFKITTNRQMKRSVTSCAQKQYNSWFNQLRAVVLFTLNSTSR